MTRLCLAALVLAALPASAAPRPPANPIDGYFKKAWAKVKPKRYADDAEFLRRARLDLTGTIPTADEAEAFLRDKDAKKRDRLLDELVASREHAAYWAQLWTVALLDWYQYGYEGYDRIEFRDWLEKKYAEGTPWNRIAQAILSAQGTAVNNPAANFAIKYLSESPEAFSTRVTKTFMGIRLSCAQCHDHPFDSWKQTDFYGFASFLARAQVTYKTRHGDGEGAILGVTDVPYGDGLTPNDPDFTAPVPPKFLGGKTPATNLWRQEFAVLVTKDPQFARAFVNRTWTQLMGRGIVHPPENFSSKNPPSHPELLDALTEDFVAHGYDIKRLVRTIVGSKAYELTSDNAGFDPGSEKDFVFAIGKPLSPFQYYNAVSRANGHERQFDDPYLMIREREDLITYVFVDSLDTDASARHAFTDSTQNLLTKLSRDYLSDCDVFLNELVETADDRRIDRLYLAVLGRYPTAAEKRICENHIGTASEDDPTAPLRDLFYALVNSHEFNVNH